MSDTALGSNLKDICGVIKSHIQPSSRIILLANNPSIPPEVFRTLAIQEDDIVVMFNTLLHKKHALNSKEILVFQNNHLGTAWGFNCDGSPTPHVQDTLSGGKPPIAILFSNARPNKVAVHLPENLPVYSIYSSTFMPFYPNRGGSKIASIGFYGYMLLKHIKATQNLPNPIYLVGFTGKLAKIGENARHDWFFEQHTISQDNETIKVFCGNLNVEAHASASILQKPAEDDSQENPTARLDDDEISKLAAECTLRQDVVRFARKGGIGVELGVAEGEFSERVLKTGRLKYLYSVDMYAGDRGHNVAQYARVLKRLEPFRSQNSVIKMKFDEALSVFDDESLDFIYVDGYAHTGEDDGHHFYTWWEKLKTGGIMAGDDYSPSWPKVIKAVKNFSIKKDLKIHIIDCRETGSPWSKSPSWFTVKR
jgi:hypothetical protein